jgi:putative sugar O-methyltransferase
MYQRHLTALYRSGAIDRLAKLGRPINILEIGAGYGPLAYFIKRIFPDSRYHVIDLAESLIFSSVYLGVTLEDCVAEHSIYDGVDKPLLAAPGRHFTFLPNFLCEDLAGRVKFDLAINTGSFGEMTGDQVSVYADLVSKVLNANGMFYEENQDMFIPVSKILGKKFNPRGIEGLKKLWSLG